MSYMTESEKKCFREGVIRCARQIVNHRGVIPLPVMEWLAENGITEAVIGISAMLKEQAEGQLKLAYPLPPPGKEERYERARLESGQAQVVHEPVRDLIHGWTAPSPEFHEVLTRLEGRKHTVIVESDSGELISARQPGE